MRWSSGSPTTPDAAARCRPAAPPPKPADLVIMALGNAANPIIKDSEPRLETSKWGTIDLDHHGSQETTLAGVYTGGDAARGGSTAILAAGDGQSAAREILGDRRPHPGRHPGVRRACRRVHRTGATEATILAKADLSDGIVEFTVRAPADRRGRRRPDSSCACSRNRTASSSRSRWPTGTPRPARSTSSCRGSGPAASRSTRWPWATRSPGSPARSVDPATSRATTPATVVFTAGGLGLPPVYPIMREHLRMGNHVTLISGFRSADLMFWTGPGERIGRCRRRVRRPARRRLHHQRRIVRRPGLRHRAAGADARARAKVARWPRSSPSARR